MPEAASGEPEAGPIIERMLKHSSTFSKDQLVCIWNNRNVQIGPNTLKDRYEELFANVTATQIKDAVGAVRTKSPPPTDAVKLRGDGSAYLSTSGQRWVEWQAENKVSKTNTGLALHFFFSHAPVLETREWVREIYKAREPDAG